MRPARALSALVTLLADAIPLVGVLIWGWNAFAILVFYWLEDLVLLAWHLPRVLLLAYGRPAPAAGRRTGQIAYLSLAGLAALAGAHLLVLLYVWGVDRALGGERLAWPSGSTLGWLALSLVLSYGLGFWHDTLAGRAWLTRPYTRTALLPYARALPLSVAFVVGGLAAAGEDGGLRVLTVLVVVKALVDLGVQLGVGREAERGVERPLG